MVQVLVVRNGWELSPDAPDWSGKVLRGTTDVPDGYTAKPWKLVQVSERLVHGVWQRELAKKRTRRAT